jgi:hypothetical protein
MDAEQRKYHYDQADRLLGRASFADSPEDRANILAEAQVHVLMSIAAALGGGPVQTGAHDASSAESLVNQLMSRTAARSSQELMDKLHRPPGSEGSH